MPRIWLAFVLTSSLGLACLGAGAAGCGSGDNGVSLGDSGSDGNVQPLDSGTRDSSVGTDTGTRDTSVVTDTGTTTDTGIPPTDSGTRADTGAPTDSGMGMDTGVADTGVTDTGTPDTNVADTGVADTGAADTGVDGGMGPQGGRLLSAQGLFLWGVTSDGYIIYSDASDVIWSLSITTGTRTMIATGLTGVAVAVVGQGAFIWSNLSAMSSVGPLGVWTNTSGYHMGPTMSGASDGAIAIASDGAHVMFTSNVDAAFTTGDLVVANADLTGQTTLETRINLSTCVLQLEFHGATEAFAQTCFAGSTANAGTTVYGFTGTGWTSTALDGNSVPQGFVVDSVGLNVMLTDAIAGVVSVTISGFSTTLGGMGMPGVIQGLYVGPFGNETAVFTDAPVGSGSEIASASLSNPTNLLLLAPGFFALSKSPSEGSVMYIVTQPAMGMTTFDLSLVSLPRGTPIPLSATQTAQVFGDTFTADSNYALWTANANTSTSTGTLMAQPVAGGSPIVVGTNTQSDFAVSASTIIYNDNYTTPMGANPRADLKWMNLATGSPNLIAAQADARIAMTADHSMVVYTYNAGTASQNGLYIYTVP